MGRRRSVWGVKSQVLTASGLSQWFWCTPFILHSSHWTWSSSCQWPNNGISNLLWFNGIKNLSFFNEDIPLLPYFLDCTALGDLYSQCRAGCLISPDWYSQCRHAGCLISLGWYSQCHAGCPISPDWFNQGLADCPISQTFSGIHSCAAETMVVSKEQTEMCYYSRRETNRTNSVYFKYLGAVITSDRRCVAECKSRIGSKSHIS